MAKRVIFTAIVTPEKAPQMSKDFESEKDALSWIDSLKTAAPRCAARVDRFEYDDDADDDTPKKSVVWLAPSEVEALKRLAKAQGRTYSALVRSILTAYIEKASKQKQARKAAPAPRVHFAVHYGIKRFDSKGNERPADIAVYECDTIEDASAACSARFDQMVCEMQARPWTMRQNCAAFAFVLAVDDDGEAVFAPLDDDTKDALRGLSFEKHAER